MASFLDFIKNRQQQRDAEPPRQQSPQTARDLYAQLDAQEKANRAPLSAQAKADADRVAARLDTASWSLQSRPATGAPSETGSHSEPMLQNALNQDKTAPALSPTTEQVGRVSTSSKTPSDKRFTPDDIVAEERMKGIEQNSQAPTPSKAQRPERGGWER